MSGKRVRALRGAISVPSNSADAIVDATERVLTEMLARNGVAREDVVSVLFTATPDLDAEFPAVAARRLGLVDVALMCAQEMAVPGAPPRCVRVLAHVYTERPPDALRHVYLGDARALREDLAEK